MIIVFGCGGERDKQKRPLMAKTASKYCDFSIVTSDNSRSEPLSEIIEDILKGFRETEKRTVITDRKKAIEYAILTADKNDVVIIAGKGAEDYIIDANGTAPFSEKDIIKDALLIREKRYLTPKR
jgi:UDP-N-acetylmuramoyl-L-alanyl-D-glutamate--2,6-diaminopimelate ligase